ncbi:hypothetical protein [Polaribacter sp. R77954]|uniref:hypothetical protein n=1 Tax=Polaribacter sp. R77954 TaxID=3093870 RepID=UPI0037C7981C
MNILNKIKYVLLLFSIVFSSCSTKKREKAIFLDNPNVFRIKLENGETEIVRKNHADDYIFESWNAYNMVNTQLSLMENEEYKISKNRIVYLKKFMNNLAVSIPNWLQTNAINQELEDVEEEFDKLIDELDESTHVIRKNCRELNQEFNELQKEVKKTVKSYTNT